MKKKAADEVCLSIVMVSANNNEIQTGVSCNVESYAEDISEKHLLDQIIRLNKDSSVHGILVQLPLPSHISEHAITSAVTASKDVDGFSVANIGELAKRGGKPRFIPCTPLAVMTLLRESGIELAGKHAVVLGRSDIVGGPVSLLLRNADTTVTMCHARSKNIPDIVKLADVVVSAIGKPNYIKGDWLKEGVVIIDVGINYIPDKTKKSGHKLVGDVDYGSATEKASYITPVPGGVGPMTVSMLLQNVVDATSVNAASVYNIKTNS